LFRAVPLAGAALLGTRFGGRRYWIVGALILQALVFGAGHANYPTQPSYARVVELFLPAVFWGVLYLAYGLIPVIVLHVTFDVVLISLPLWVSSAPGLWDDRLLVVMFALIPLWAVLLARWRQGRWKPVEADGLNGAWVPPPPPVSAPVVLAGRQPGLAGTSRNVLWALGAAGAIAWLVLFRIPGDAPPLQAQRGQVIAAADQALSARGLTPPESFRTLAEVQAGQALTHRFVWQEGDAELYADLLGRYLPAPRWHIRYANFEGDVAARAEEFHVWVDVTGQVTRASHQLAEATPGADLGEDEARAQALAAAMRTYGFDADALREVKASPSKEELRTDWHFEFSDDAAFPLEEGEARVGVVLAGDEVADTFRYVHLPEKWEREERNRTMLATVVQILCVSLSLGVFVSGAVLGIIHWSRRQFGVATFVTFLLSLVALRSVLYMMNWPMMAAQFQTALGFNLQAGLFVVTSLLVVVVGSGVVALNLGLVDRWRPAAAGRGGLVSGVALGALVAGLAVVLARLAPQSEPHWLAYGPAGTVVPWLGAALGPLSSFITTATLMLLVFVGMHRWTTGWTQRKGSASVGFLLLGWIFAGRHPVDSLPGWLILGATLGAGMWAAYVWLLRFDLSLVPPAAATLAVAGAISGAMGNAYPGALGGSVLAVVLIGAVALWWHRSLVKNVGPAQVSGA
ncbi:MAG: CPBP family intramembrane glutamic endopeptidase, partial [Planctomycetota bacterium]